MSHQLLWSWIQTLRIHVSSCLMIWPVWDWEIINLFLIIQRDLTVMNVFWVQRALTQEHTAGMWRLKRFNAGDWSNYSIKPEEGTWFLKTDVWFVWYGWSFGSGFHVNHYIDRVRVYLDYDRGIVSFSDPVTNTHLHTFTTTFTHTLFPFFHSSSSLRILAINSQ